MPELSKPMGGGPVAKPANQAGNVSRPQAVPKGGSADTSAYCTYEGSKANGKRASDGKKAPDGGLGFSSDERMTRSGYSNGDTGFEKRTLPDRSNVLNANAVASDMTKSRPKLTNRRSPAAT